MTIENQIDIICEKLDTTTNDLERKVLEAKLFELVETLNGNTVYLTLQ
jgi:hypothetical protein